MSSTELKAGWLLCQVCRRAGTWWELNTLACSHAKGCALAEAERKERER